MHLLIVLSATVLWCQFSRSFRQYGEDSASLHGGEQVVRIPAAAEDALTQAIRDSFKNVVQPGQEFFLQLKSEEWGVVLFDMLGQTVIADRSVVRAVMKPVTEVSKLAVWLSTILICTFKYVLNVR